MAVENAWVKPVRVLDKGNLVFLLGALFIILLLYVTVSTPRIFSFADSGMPVNSSQYAIDDLSDRYGFVSRLYSVPILGPTIRNTLNATGVFPDVTNDLKIKYSFRNLGSTSWVEGKLKNTGNRTLRGVMVYFTLRDESGNPVGTTYALISDVSAGNVFGFSTYPVNVSASSATLQNIIGG